MLTLGQTNNETNEKYIEKQDSRKIKYILADSFQTDMNRIKEVLEEKGVKQTWFAEQLGKFTIWSTAMYKFKLPIIMSKTTGLIKK